MTELQHRRQVLMSVKNHPKFGPRILHDVPENGTTETIL